MQFTEIIVLRAGKEQPTVQLFRRSDAVDVHSDLHVQMRWKIIRVRIRTVQIGENDAGDDQPVAMKFLRSFDQFAFRCQRFETIQFDARQIIAELFQNRVDTGENVEIDFATAQTFDHRQHRSTVERIHADDAADQRLNQLIRQDFLRKIVADRNELKRIFSLYFDVVRLLKIVEQIAEVQRRVDPHLRELMDFV